MTDVAPAFALCADNATLALHRSLWDGLVGYWPTAIGSTGRAQRDMSGRGKHLTASSGLTLDKWTAQFGGLREHDGVDDYFTAAAPAGSALDTGTNLTVGFTGVIEATTSRIAFQRFSWTGTTGEDLFFWVNGSNFTFSITGSINTAGQITVTRPALNTKFKATGTYDGSVMRLYIDGVQAGSKSVSVTAASTSEPWIFGADSDSPGAGGMGNYWDGFLGDFFIYNRCLTPYEVAIWHRELAAPLILDPELTPEFALIAPAAGGGQTLQPSGIASAESIGSHTVSPGAATVQPSAIASGEAFGTHQLNMQIVASSVASGEAFGSANVTPGVVTVTPTGIVSGEAFGTAVIDVAGALSPTGIPSAEAFGTTQLNMQVQAGSVASGEAFGTAQLSRYLQPSAIASGEAFGTAVVANAGLVLQPTGLPSAEAFGTAQLNLQILPGGITSAEAFGTLSIGDPNTQTTAGWATWTIYVHQPAWATWTIESNQPGWATFERTRP